MNRVDVDKMLDEMTPAQFEDWQVSYLLDPWDHDWQQAGTIAAEIRNFKTTLVAGLGRTELKEEDFVTADDMIPELTFEPIDETETKQRIDIVDIKIDESNMERIYGDQWQPLEH